MGMAFTAYHLDFTAPLHMGIESIGQERIEHTIRSDTLWGALFSKWLLLFDDEPEDLINDPPFHVSSCFPFMDGVHYFPCPLGALDSAMNKAAEMPGGFEPGVKALKKVRYLSRPLFEKVLNGGSIELEDCVPGALYPLEIERDSKDSAGIKQFAREVQRPRIRTDQLNQGAGEDAFFYCSDLYFNEGCGLFFLAQFASEEAQERFEAALFLLGDSGLAADTSIGKGRFRYSREEISLNTCDGQGAVLLSLCFPTKDDVAEGVLTSPATRYSLVRRFGMGGTMGVNRLRRPDCWMFSEGSIFPRALNGQTIRIISKGMAGDDHIPHDVYRYGMAFCLPFPV